MSKLSILLGTIFNNERRITKMHKCVKPIIIALLVLLSLQQAVFASSESKRPPKPTEGIETSDPNYGSSEDTQVISPESISGLLTDWKCSIKNNGSDLYLDGQSTALDMVDHLQLILYLQKWDGSQWIDISSWEFNKYNAKSIYEGTNSDYQHGYYYRTRAVHYAENGSQTDTQYSTSTYIYAP